MKKIYNAPEAIEIILDAQDVITASPIVTADSGDGIYDDWSNGKTA